MPRDRGRSVVNKVVTKDLRDKGERPRGTEITLDDLEFSGSASLVGGLTDDLHVVRAGDLERGGDLLSDLLQAEHLVVSEGEGREDQGSIAGVHTGVLHMFGDGVQEKLALVRDSVNINLLSVVDELGDDNRV